MLDPFSRRVPMKPLLSRAALLAALLLGAGMAPQAPAQAPGTRYEVRPEDMPAPYASQSVSQGPQRAARPESGALQVPEGFEATLFAAGLTHPRALLVLPNGDVLLAESRAGQVTLLRDTDGDGQADAAVPYARGFVNPYGMALQGEWLYIADGRGVHRARHRPGALALEDSPERITPPDALGDPGGHWSRTLVFHPDGERFYVGIGSRGNIGVESEPRATIQEFWLEEMRQLTYAAGLRNPIGMAFHPDTGELFTVVNERDGLGDHLVPDYLTHVVRDGFYGWPYAYIGANPQPDYAERRPELVERTIVPDLLFKSHSAPIDLVFYDDGDFPADYRGDAFVSLRGSWNRSDPVGYMVVHVPFENGRPVGWYQAFATGFRLDEPGDQGRARVWGRPTGLAVDNNGALLVADDTGGTVWRIRHVGD
ncbi:MAG: sorbosone dehydrogenase [Alphaproteobacteria bacterium]|nr:sorbosone dehydrogenase [Alphaproteobacteria bacterium]